MSTQNLSAFQKTQCLILYTSTVSPNFQLHLYLFTSPIILKNYKQFFNHTKISRLILLDNDGTRVVNNFIYL